MTTPLPARARIVIIGGGVGGTSLAHHLARRGETDVLLVERAELTSGSTFHSAGLVGQLRSDPALTTLNTWSVELYRELEATEHAPGWVESGSLRLASSPDRLTEIRRQAAWAQRSGLPLELLSAAQAQALFPPMSTDGVLGAAYTPTDGQVDPSRLTYALAALARAAGVRIAQRTRVTGIDRHAGRVRRVRTDRGDVECEVVVDCGGMFAAEIARMVGVRVPVVPMSHQYVVTAPLAGGLPDRMPSLRDPDLLVYYRQEGPGLVMGGYERRSAAFAASASSHAAVPADFNGRLLPPDLDRFDEIVANAQVRVPALADTGLASVINGPEGFTPDNEFCLGGTEVGGFFVSAGFCAHGIAGAGGVGRAMAAWILDGDPGLDLRHMDVRRFGPEYRSPAHTLARVRENYETYYDLRHPGAQRSAGRPLRTSAAHAWHAAHGAVFGEVAGWERVEHYDEPGDEGLRPRGFAGVHWSPCVQVEARALRERAGLVDASSTGTIEVSGPDAAAFCRWAFCGAVDGPVGGVVRALALTDRGGIACDVTVTRVAAEEFLVATAAAALLPDLAFLRGRAAGYAVRVADVTGAGARFGLWGPAARDLLAPLTPDDLAFPDRTARETTVGDVPVRAVRAAPAGLPGWELHCRTEFGAGLWAVLAAAGARPCGHRAVESVRLEEGHLRWGSDLGPGTTPDEAGLAAGVRAGGGYAGAEALAARRAAGPPARALHRLVLDDLHTVALGGEPVRVDGAVAGYVATGGQGHAPDASLALAHLPAATVAGTRVEVVVDGDPVGAVAARA